MPFGKRLSLVEFTIFIFLSGFPIGVQLEFRVDRSGRKSQSKRRRYNRRRGRSGTLGASNPEARPSFVHESRQREKVPTSGNSSTTPRHNHDDGVGRSLRNDLGRDSQSPQE